MAQWITRLTTDQKILGSTPGWLGLPFLSRKNVFLCFFKLVRENTINEEGGTETVFTRGLLWNGEWRASFLELSSTRALKEASPGAPEGANHDLESVQSR